MEGETNVADRRADGVEEFASGRPGTSRDRPLVLAVVLLAAGCAALPTGRFDTLAAAAKGVEARTTETDAEVVQLTRRFMLFSPAPGPYTVNSFVPAVDIDGRKFDFDFGPRL